MASTTAFTAGNLLISRSVYTGVVTTVPFPGTLPNGAASLANGTYPNVFLNAGNDASFGVTSPIFLDQVTTAGSLVNSEDVTAAVKALGKNLSTSFPSKSELALNLTPDGTGVTFLSYLAAPNLLDISNSDTPGYIDLTNPAGSVGTYQRAITRIDSSGNIVDLTPINAYSGNNGRAALLGTNGLYYTVGNAGNGGNIAIAGATTVKDSKVVTTTSVQGLVVGQTVTGANIPTATPVTIVSIDPTAKTFTLSAAATATGADATGKVIQTPATLSLLSSDTGVQAIAPGSTTGKTTVVGIERGVPGGAGDQYGFAITDVPGITAPDKTGKDDNFRGLTLNPYDNSLYVTKGSGGNGINTVYKVNTPNGALPTLANANTASISILPGFPTDLAAGSPQFFPFGIWFANATTLYVADEGAPITVKSAADIATAAKDVNAGLEKWSLVNGSWKLDYTLQNGLNLGQDYSTSVAKGANGEVYSNPIATAGLRNITGKVNGDGTVSIYGVTSTASTATDQGADPNKVVAITDNLAAMTLPTSEAFTTIESAKAGEVLRGVSTTPTATAVAPPVIVPPASVVIPPAAAKIATAFKHVLVISVDGLHNSDLNVANLQSSLTNIKRLQSQGITYTNAFSSAPSDSFPGELNYITGANPGTTGVFYDKSYTDALYAPGTTAAQIASGAVKPGTTVEFAENVDKSWAALPAGTSGNGTLNGGLGFDVSQLPVDSKGNPVYPNQYLKVNTIFDVAKAAGLTTAWSDKHPAAYTILAGNTQDPTKFNFATGQVGSIDDYSSLEINAAVAIDTTKKGPLPTSVFGALVDQSTGTAYSNTNPNITSAFFNDATKGNTALFKAPPAGTTAAQFTSYATTSTYDDYKVKQILNEIDGFNDSGTTSPGTPSIFGLNLQAVSVAEKEPGTLFNGGGIDANGNARPDLVSAINHTDQSIGLILDELKKTGQADSTLVILTAKHGQNPVQDPTVGLNSVFDSTTGAVGGDGNLTAIGALLARNGIALASERGGDTSSLIYLKNPADVQKAVALLNTKNYSFDTAIDTVSDPTGKTTFGTEDAAAQGTILYGQALINAGLGDPLTNDRSPDIAVALNTGYFFGNATKKRSEHGGFTDADTHVATIVGSTGLAPSLQGKVEAQTVSTTQIAVTTLQALGLDANQLQGVQLNGTTALPDLTPAALLTYGNKIVAGSNSDDTAIVPTRNDTIFTDGGNDLVDASVASGGNRIYGGDGNDELYAGKNDRLFGENGDDILDASQGKGGNRLYGGAGNDTLFAGTNDFLSGGDGSDTLYAGKGGNTLYGGAGADKFYLAYNGAPTSTNTVADFEVGIDSLVILGISGVTDFSKVTLAQKGADTLITAGGKDLAVLSGIQSSTLTGSSFKFA